MPCGVDRRGPARQDRGCCGSQLDVYVATSHLAHSSAHTSHPSFAKHGGGRQPAGLMEFKLEATQGFGQVLSTDKGTRDCAVPVSDSLGTQTQPKLSRPGFVVVCIQLFQLLLQLTKALEMSSRVPPATEVAGKDRVWACVVCPTRTSSGSANFHSFSRTHDHLVGFAC